MKDAGDESLQHTNLQNTTIETIQSLVSEFGFSPESSREITGLFTEITKQIDGYHAAENYGEKKNQIEFIKLKKSIVKDAKRYGVNLGFNEQGYIFDYDNKQAVTMASAIAFIKEKSSYIREAEEKLIGLKRDFSLAREKLYDIRDSVPDAEDDIRYVRAHDACERILGSIYSEELKILATKQEALRVQKSSAKRLGKSHDNIDKKIKSYQNHKPNYDFEEPNFLKYRKFELTTPNIDSIILIHEKTAQTAALLDQAFDKVSEIQDNSVKKAIKQTMLNIMKNYISGIAPEAEGPFDTSFKKVNYKHSLMINTDSLQKISERISEQRYSKFIQNQASFEQVLSDTEKLIKINRKRQKRAADISEDGLEKQLGEKEKRGNPYAKRESLISRISTSINEINLAAIEGGFADIVYSIEQFFVDKIPRAFSAMRRYISNKLFGSEEQNSNREEQERMAAAEARRAELLRAADEAINRAKQDPNVNVQYNIQETLDLLKGQIDSYDKLKENSDIKLAEDQGSKKISTPVKVSSKKYDSKSSKEKIK